MGILSAVFSGDPLQIVLYLLAISVLIFFVMPVHECAHALMAKILGDDTAERSGRLTLDPMAHLDMTGALCMLLIGFGWANPVPVNPVRFKNQKRRQGYMALVAAAGPLSNLVMAFLWMVVYRAVLCFGISNVALNCVHYVFQTIVFINIGLAVFNMLPIGPLDGAKIFNWLLPDKLLYKIENSLGKLMSRVNPIVYLALFWVFIRIISGPLGTAEEWLFIKLFNIVNAMFRFFGL